MWFIFYFFIGKFSHFSYSLCLFFLSDLGGSKNREKQKGGKVARKEEERGKKRRGKKEKEKRRLSASEKKKKKNYQAWFLRFCSF
jgi:hypothetical protein